MQKSNTIKFHQNNIKFYYVFKKKYRRRFKEILDLPKEVTITFEKHSDEANKRHGDSGFLYRC